MRGVPQIVEEILYNLCDNAVAYNRPGGTVTVTVEDTPEGARVTVADTGIGIPPEAQNRVFERFYRVDKSHPSGGTGLGPFHRQAWRRLPGCAGDAAQRARKGQHIRLAVPQICAVIF